MISVMKLKKIPYAFAAWRMNPHELINRAIYSNDPENYGERKHRVHEVVLFMTRLGLRPLTMRSLKAAYKHTRYTPIGFGYYTIALRKGEDVTKIYEFSLRCSEAEREALVRSLNDRIMIANNYLKDFLTPTQVAIMPHPITGENCVVLKQKYIAGTPLARKPYARYLTDTQRKSFEKLLGNAEKLLDETGYLLDVNGHNLIANGDSVKIVDTVLMGKVDVKMRPVTLRILRNEIKELEALKKM